MRYWSIAQTVGTCVDSSCDSDTCLLQARAQIRRVLPTAVSPTSTHLTSSWCGCSLSMLYCHVDRYRCVCLCVRGVCVGLMDRHVLTVCPATSRAERELLEQCLSDCILAGCWLASMNCRTNVRYWGWCVIDFFSRKIHNMYVMFFVLCKI